MPSPPPKPPTTPLYKAASEPDLQALPGALLLDDEGLAEDPGGHGAHTAGEAIDEEDADPAASSSSANRPPLPPQPTLTLTLSATAPMAIPGASADADDDVSGVGRASAATNALFRRISSGSAPIDLPETPVSFTEYMEVEAAELREDSLRAGHQWTESTAVASSSASARYQSNVQWQQRQLHQEQQPPQQQSRSKLPAPIARLKPSRHSSPEGPPVPISLSLPKPADDEVNVLAPAVAFEPKSPASRRREQTLENARAMVPVTPAVSGCGEGGAKNDFSVVAKATAALVEGVRASSVSPAGSSTTRLEEQQFYYGSPSSRGGGVSSGGEGAGVSARGDRESGGGTGDSGYQNGEGDGNRGPYDETHSAGGDGGGDGNGSGGGGGDGDGGAQGSASGFAARRYKLMCIEISGKGDMHERKLSRAEIMQEARDTLPKSAPSPKAVARMLGRPNEESKELQDFNARYGTGNKDTSRKAMQKALRNYLRNSLQPRDIRQVDPAFSAKPALWVRHSALVVSLEGVRAIILHNKAFLFDPTSPVTKTAVSAIRQKVKSGADMMEDPEMPFEFRALEGIFVVGITGLEAEFNLLNPVVEQNLQELPKQLTSKMLEELRLNKQRLNHFLSRAQNVGEILEKLLEEDAEMAEMYLSEKHRAPHVGRDVGDHDEVEMLLEAYAQIILDVINRAELLQSAIDDAEDLIMIHLDTLRNKLLGVELALSVFSMTFGFGGLVSGIFGMNLSIPLFEPDSSPFWFLVVVVFVFATVLVVSWLVLNQLRRRGLYSFVS